MAFTDYDTPEEFFGPGYSLASSAISLTTGSNAGTTIGTFTADDATDVITTSAAHNRKVGDIVQFSSSGTLPAGLSAATDYYVLTRPSSTTMTVSETSGGTVVDITDTGTGTHSAIAPGLLSEVTDTEANASTGDSRKVLYGFMEMFRKAYTNIPTADRPAKATVQRTTFEDSSTGEFVLTYQVTIRSASPSFEVADE